MNQSGQEISVRPETKMAFKPEYVGSFSLCPSYSIKQLRRIDYIQHKYGHGKLSPFNTGLYRNVHRYISLADTKSIVGAVRGGIE